MFWIYLHGIPSCMLYMCLLILEGSSSLSLVEFCSIVRHSPNHGQWENAWPLSGIRVNLVKDQMDLVRDLVVLVRD